MNIKSRLIILEHMKRRMANHDGFFKKIIDDTTDRARASLASGMPPELPTKMLLAEMTTPEEATELLQVFSKFEDILNKKNLSNDIRFGVFTDILFSAFSDYLKQEEHS